MITPRRLFEIAGIPIPHILLIEGYKEATAEFSAISPEAPAKIAQYKDLVQRNQATGDERNIDYWRKQGWDAFVAFVDNPSEELQLLAVTRDGLALQYIKTPSEQVQRRAVQTTGVALRYIEDQTDEIVALALAEDPGAIGYVKNPTEEMLQNYISRAPHMIHRIKNPSFEVQKLAVQASGRNIVEIPNPSEELQWIAVRQNPDNVRYIKPQATEEVQKYAIQQDDSVYKNIKHPTPGATALQAELWGS